MAQLSSILCNPMDCSPPGSFVHEDSPGKYPGVAPMPSSKGSSQTRDWTQVSHIAGRFFTVWATREAHMIVDYFPRCTFHICDSFIYDSSFQMPICHLYVFFGKYLFRSSAIFYNNWVVLYCLGVLCWVIWVLYTLDINSLQTYHLQTSSPIQ